MPVSSSELQAEIRALRERLDTQTAAHDKIHQCEGLALTLAREELNGRLESMNEFRAQITESEAKYITRNEWDAQNSTLRVKVEADGQAVENRLRAIETAFTSMNAAMLGPEYSKATDSRFRGLEKLVWMGAGAMFIINLIVHFWKP